MEIFDKDFTDSNFGFRRGKSQHAAIGHVRDNALDGYQWCASIDLRSFFDEIPHGLILKLIRRRISDERLLTVLARALKAGVIVDGNFEKTLKGCPQGSPLSPMLSNIVLNELDYELERRGHRYCRWADDFVILTQSERAASRVMESITNFLEEKLGLPVNKEKSEIVLLKDVEFLGFQILRGKIRISTNARNKFKDKVRELTKRQNSGHGNFILCLIFIFFVLKSINKFFLFTCARSYAQEREQSKHQQNINIGDTMTMSQNQILIETEPNPPGYISGRCRFHDDAGIRYVFANDILAHTFDIDDKTALRQVSVSLFRSNLATQVQLAEAWGYTNKSLCNWVAACKKGGMGALVDKGRPGAPRKVTEEVKKQIRRFRREGKTLPQICQITNLSYGSVCTVLYTKIEETDLFEESVVDSENSHADEDDEPADLILHGDDEVDKFVWDEADIDPLNRRQDRMYARLGLLQDAAPVFATSHHLEFAGSFLAVAMLDNDPYLEVVCQLFGNFKAAFYGVRTMFMTMLLMALLRIKTNEQISRYNPQKLGRILGLDRAPCVKTQRRKLRQLTRYNRAVKFMERLAKKRTDSLQTPLAILYVDGHVYSYSGKVKVSKTFSSNKNRVVKGITDYWVNMTGGGPLLCITTEFNDDMPTVFPKLLAHVKTLCKTRRITVVFDRGGASHALYEKLIKDVDIITYRKNHKPVELSCFKKKKTVINGKEYEYAPYVREATLNVYEKVGSQSRKTKRTITLREIIIRRQDGGQTAILTSRRDLDPEVVASILFDRWSQENYFKYMLAEYNLDHLCVYGSKNLSADIDHPNPDYTRLEKNLKMIKQKMAAILSRDLVGLADEDLARAVEQFQKVHKGKAGKRLHQLGIRAGQIQSQIKDTPKRITPLEYKRLKSEARLLTNAVKISAWHIETALVKLLAKYYKKADQDGRATVVAMIKSSGALCVRDKSLHITLEPQATPQKTELLRKLCCELNNRNTKFPGSDKIIKFDVAA